MIVFYLLNLLKRRRFLDTIITLSCVKISNIQRERMNYILLFITMLLFIGCGSKEVYKKKEYTLTNNETFLVINPLNDPVNLSDLFIDELKKRGYKIKLAHPKSSHSNKPVKSSQGSGFFINHNGLIVTNHHVIENFNFLNIQTTSQGNFKAVVILKDKENDIALLKPVQDFSSTHWFSMRNNHPVIGNKINVIGYPLSQVLGTDVRITQGIISSERGIKGDGTRFQISAPVQPGNSGGPILDENFRVIGIATSRLSDKYMFQYLDIIPQNVNFGVKSMKIFDLLNRNNINLISKSNVKNFQDAVKATVLINSQTIKNHSIPVNNTLKERYLKLSYNYTYHWEFNSISYLSIKLSSSDNEELIHIKFSGDSLSSPTEIARESLLNIFK